MNVIDHKIHLETTEFKKFNLVPMNEAHTEFLARFVFKGLILEVVLSREELLSLYEEIIDEVENWIEK